MVKYKVVLSAAVYAMVLMAISACEARAQSVPQGGSPAALLLPALPSLHIGSAYDLSSAPKSYPDALSCATHGYFWYAKRCNACPVGKLARAGGKCECPVGFLDNGPRASCRCPTGSTVFYSSKGAQCRMPTTAAAEDPIKSYSAAKSICGFEGTASCSNPESIAEGPAPTVVSAQ